jgi:hypothetical protein
VRHAGCIDVHGYLLSPLRAASEAFDLIAGFGSKAAAA